MGDYFGINPHIDHPVFHLPLPDTSFASGSLSGCCAAAIAGTQHSSTRAVKRDIASVRSYLDFGVPI